MSEQPKLVLGVSFSRFKIVDTLGLELEASCHVKDIGSVLVYGTCSVHDKAVRPSLSVYVVVVYGEVLELFVNRELSTMPLRSVITSCMFGYDGGKDTTAPPEVTIFPGVVPVHVTVSPLPSIVVVDKVPVAFEHMPKPGANGWLFPASSETTQSMYLVPLEQTDVRTVSSYLENKAPSAMSTPNQVSASIQG
jgi:hypothetical protein